jgi:hypothetical protein
MILQIIMVVLLLFCFYLGFIAWKKLNPNEHDLTKCEEDNFSWQIILAVFSVTLYYSLYNASIINIVSYGDFIYWVFLQSQPINWYEFLSTILYTILIVGNIIIIGYFKKYTKCIQDNFWINWRFNIKIVVSMFLGITPMFVYYIVYLSAVAFYPQIIINPQTELLKTIENLLKNIT